MYTKKYLERWVSAEQALSCVKSGQLVYVHPGCAEPEALVMALVAQSQKLTNVKIIHLLTLGNADYVLPKHSKTFHHIALFAGANVREAIREGRAEYVPVFLSEIPRLFTSGVYKPDVALIHVSPPDTHGFCSFGVGLETTLAATQAAKTIIAQVNPQMPRVHGQNFIHISKIDYLVAHDKRVLELKPPTLTETHRRIGRHIAEMVEDGATLQLGIGGIPNAVLAELGGKKNLGIHTEMFSDGVLDLIQKGVINGEAKTLLPGKIVSSFVLGTRELYNFMHHNPMIEFRPSDFTNDVAIIARNEKMVAVNSAIQIDLSGQVCSDSMGHEIFSGIGGQVDYIRGAARSKGGKPIIALPATAKGGEVSRIVPTLSNGSGVVTSRGDCHYVVTENGVVNLWGRSLNQRARLLISIADEKFKPWLEEEARKMNLI